MNKAEQLKQYWADVKAGLREPPKRTRNGKLSRVTAKELDGSYGPDRGRRIVQTYFVCDVFRKAHLSIYLKP